MKYQHIFESVVKASRELLTLSPGKIDEILLALAIEAEKETPFLIGENKRDLERMDVNDPKYDRLQLSTDRIKGIASDIRRVSTLPSPVGKVLERRDLENELHLEKISVPLGVVGIIYEARPNVTFDVFSLCLKSKNACLLKGGSDAHFSNEAIIAVIKKVLNDFGVNPSFAELLPSDREATHEMLTARGYVDVIIPRGSQSLINYVADNAKIPIIETGAGIVHTYLDENADLQKASAIIHNAKTRRCSVCNALDCLIVHRSQLSHLAGVLSPLGESEVLLYADAPAFEALEGKYPKKFLLPVTEESYGTEFLSMRMAVKTVNSFDEALNHIQRYSSKHSEAIISTDAKHIERFLNEVDAAAVYANASTAFTDGAQFGMGAEIGISTQKLHARGPMALPELTSYKWIVRGNGQIRPK